MPHNRSEPQHDERHEQQTMWTLRRDPHTASCVLFRWGQVWELRVLIDGTSLLAERCAANGDALALADRWKNRLRDRAWRQTLPAARSRSQAN